MRKNITFFLLFTSFLCQSQSLSVRSSADYLRLRKSPDVSSPIVKVVMKGDGLGIITDTSATRKTVNWNGQQISDYWYQVKYYDREGLDSSAWVHI